MRTIDIIMKGLVVITCLYLVDLTFGRTPPPKVTYEGNQLWKITNRNETTLKLLRTLEKENHVTLWALDSTEVDAMVHADSVNRVKEKLLQNKLEYEVQVEDIQKAIEEENPKPEEDLEGRKGYRLTWNYYHSLDDIHGYLHYLVETFPKLCALRTIGRSVEGRPIKLLRISSGQPDRKAVFIEGGIHAREWISPAAVTYVIQQFISNYENEASYVRNIDWYFVPVLNPDGYEHSYNIERLWRKNRATSRNNTNCVGVDLNRNWGYDWNKNGSSSDPCSNSYRGRKPFSEPETASVARFFLNNPEIDWIGYIAVHSYGQFIVYPWGSLNAIVEDQEELHAVGTEAAQNIISAGGEPYAVGPTGLTIYRASGISSDWARGVHAVKYAYTIELRDKGHHGFILPARFIKATSEEAVIAIRSIAKATGA